jgi:very-short-patch-repair endonuclease
MKAHSVRIGDAATFQGDERDVVFLSTVVSDSGGRPIGAMTSKRYQQMVNVAASRARDQLWIVHSVGPDAFPKGDERAALIRHCSATKTASEAYDSLVGLTDKQSPFERDFLMHLVNRGYRTIRPQHKVGQYRIDFVIDGPSSRLAVECDGEKYHGPEQWDADRARQKVLERAGWTFVRIRGSAFYRNPAKSLEPLWAKLDELEIPSYDWEK